LKHYQDNLRRIVIIEDNYELRTAYKTILDSITDYKVVGTYYSCEEALKRKVKDTPDLLLMDLNLPGMSGIEGIIKYKKDYPKLKVIVISVHDDSDNVFNSFCAGASGYITKDSSIEMIISSVKEVFNGGAPMTSRIASKVIMSFHKNPKTPLTTRETEVLKNLAQGKTYDYIAKELNISKDTVKTHIRHIYEKLQVSNKSDAVVKARNEKLV